MTPSTYRSRLLTMPMATLTLSLSLSVAPPLRAADHLDAPSLAGNGQLDVADLYAFQSPSNADNAVMVLTVNPGAGVLSPTDFGTGDVGYEFLVDNDGDALADVIYGARFAGAGAAQTLVLSRNGVEIAAGNTGTTLDIAGGGMVTTGLYDDPFFFDLNGFNDGFNFTGDDFFAGLDVSAIVLEIPSSDLGGGNVGIWARTVQDGAQVDRIGRPAINTALIPSELKEAFNAGTPDTDAANFGDAVVGTITALSNPENAEALAAILLPDILTFDPSNPAGFLNGRQLIDDVIDAELGLLTAGAVAGDGVDANDRAFNGAFPFLAGPNNVVAAVSEPPLIAVICLVLAGMGWRRSRG